MRKRKKVVKEPELVLTCKNGKIERVNVANKMNENGKGKESGKHRELFL